MELWFLLALGSTLAWVISAILSKYVLKNLKPHDFGFVSCSIGLISSLVYSGLIKGPVLPSLVEGWFLIGLSAIFGIVASYSYISSLKKEDLSLVIPLVSIAPLFTVLIALFFLSEKLNQLQSVSILLLLVGVYFASLKKSDWLQPIRYVLSGNGLLIMLNPITNSIMLVLQKAALSYMDPLGIIVVNQAIVFVFWTTLMFWYEKNIFKHFLSMDKKVFCFLVLSGIFSFLQWPFYTLAISMANTSLVTPVSYAGIFLIVLSGWLVFKEKNIAVRLVGSGLILAGLGLLAM